MRSAERRTTIACGFRSRAETTRYGQFGLTEPASLALLSAWEPPHQGCGRGRQTRGVVAARIGDVMHAATIVLVVATGIAVGDGDDSAEDIID